MRDLKQPQKNKNPEGHLLLWEPGKEIRDQGPAPLERDDAEKVQELALFNRLHQALEERWPTEILGSKPHFQRVTQEELLESGEEIKVPQFRVELHVGQSDGVVVDDATKHLYLKYI